MRGWLSWTSNLRTAWCQFTHLINGCWASNGRAPPISIGPSPLGSGPPLYFSLRLQTAWPGLCSALASISHVLHYLDDFFFCAPASSPACSIALQTAIPLCHDLGFPVAPNKVEGPATSLVFLGIEIDSAKMELRLPADKLHRLRDTLLHWVDRRAATKRQLQQLLGHLHHAATVVRPGRSFTRNLINSMSALGHPSHYTRLNEGCKADIAWWVEFARAWNGISLFPHMHAGPSIISDASGSWGCGAYLHDTLSWFQLPWPADWESVDISAKELLPVVISAAIWGVHWSGLRVTFFCDNQSVVFSLSSRSGRTPHMSHLLQCLFFFEAYFCFEFQAQHIAGKINRAADALSRDQLSTFLSIFPQAPPSPSPVPPALSTMLFNPSLRWTSKSWKLLFRSTLHEVCPRQLEPPTVPLNEGSGNSVQPLGDLLSQ